MTDTQESNLWYHIACRAALDQIQANRGTLHGRHTWSHFDFMDYVAEFMQHLNQLDMDLSVR